MLQFYISGWIWSNQKEKCEYKLDTFVKSLGSNFPFYNPLILLYAKFLFCDFCAFLPAPCNFRESISLGRRHQALCDK